MRWSDASAPALERAGLSADELMLSWFGHRLRRLCHGKENVPVQEIFEILSLGYELYPEEMLEDIDND